MHVLFVEFQKLMIFTSFYAILFFLGLNDMSGCGYWWYPLTPVAVHSWLCQIYCQSMNIGELNAYLEQPCKPPMIYTSLTHLKQQCNILLRCHASRRNITGSQAMEFIIKWSTFCKRHSNCIFGMIILVYFAKNESVNEFLIHNSQYWSIWWLGTAHTTTQS